jgi:hypothetical protein
VPGCVRLRTVPKYRVNMDPKHNSGIKSVSFLQVIYLNPEDNPGAVKYFGAAAEDTPLVVVHDPSKDAKYVSGKKIDVKKVKAWIEDYKAGKIKRHIKSEEPPKKNDGPVKILTAKTYKDIVYSGKNVLIEFYAPVCRLLQ